VGDQLGDQPLPAEEVCGIIWLEAGQALVGTDRRGRVVDLLCGWALGSYQARDPLTVLVQLMQIDEIAAELGLDQTQVPRLLTIWPAASWTWFAA
jgi:hypothetical protein